MGSIVDTVESRIQKAILTASDITSPPRIELAVRSMDASAGRNTTNITANSERGERIGITAFFKNAPKKNNRFQGLNLNDDTCRNILDKVRKLSVTETHFDRKLHNRHYLTGQRAQTKKIPECSIGGIPKNHNHTNNKACHYKYYKIKIYQ